MPVSGVPITEQQKRRSIQDGRSCFECVSNESSLESCRDDYRLSCGRTISKSEEFKEAFDSGISLVGKFMVIWPREADNAESRLGVIASKRTFAKAVSRNRAKRMIREAFRLNRFRLRGGYDFVIVARRKILKATLEDVVADLLKLAGGVGKKDAQNT